MSKENLEAFAAEEKNNNLESISAFAVEDEPETAEPVMQEDISKYETKEKAPVLNNGDLSRFACGFPDFVLTVNDNVATILVQKIAERKVSAKR